MERWTVLRILKWTANYFFERGIDGPRLDAELLLAEALDLDRVGLYLNYDRPLKDAELDRFRDYVRRRVNHEPVQYILGCTEFWSLKLNVDPRVLIPRPDTEVLVEETLAQAQDGPLRILDVGTGSGAIAIAIASERPSWQVTAIDLCPQALTLASHNSEQHGLKDRIHFMEADLSKLPEGPFDLIVSNPPYIPASDWDGLMPEVRDHEPRLALVGGKDGLDAYRLLAAQSGQNLACGGGLLVEVGIGQADEVADLFRCSGMVGIDQRKDYSGIPRVVKGFRKQHNG